MNRQPYGTPPKWWPPKLRPWWVKLSRSYRLDQLKRRQKIVKIDCDSFSVVTDAVKAGYGVLITPNHSAHYDAAALYVAADRWAQPLFFMTAWQVFAMSSPFERWAMQRLGCFSVDREANDRQAYKQAVQVLKEAPYPLVVFPEGDVYHTTDVVTPFREGAAAIAQSAARRSDRKVVVLPCGIKFWYVSNPVPALHDLASELEERLYLRSADSMTLQARVHRLAEAALALKELDYLGFTREGRLRERVGYLTEYVIAKLEKRHSIRSAGGTLPERVKVLRQSAISGLQRPSSNGQRSRLLSDMEDLFFAMQLFSYPGDYLVGKPSLERLAETLDKFEEDILQRDLPLVRGQRRVMIKFGTPIEVRPTRRGRATTVELTARLQVAVQELIHQLSETAPNGMNTPPTHDN